MTKADPGLRLGARTLIFEESWGMASLMEALAGRGAEVRGRLEYLAASVVGAHAELDRLMITRETVGSPARATAVTRVATRRKRLFPSMAYL